MEQKTPKKDNNLPVKKGRRIISFTSEELEKLKHFAGLGLNQSELASVMGISESTLRRRKKDSELFDRYMREGQTKAVTDVANALYVNATTENNIQAQIFFLKNRAEHIYKDRQETVHATINLNDVLSGAKDRLGDSMATIKQPKVINAVKSTSTDLDKLVNNQNDIKKNDNKGG
jgi:transcriptional regulator with XRE-family HTH domain